MRNTNFISIMVSLLCLVGCLPTDESVIARESISLEPGETSEVFEMCGQEEHTLRVRVVPAPDALAVRYAVTFGPTPVRGSIHSGVGVSTGFPFFGDSCQEVTVTHLGTEHAPDLVANVVFTERAPSTSFADVSHDNPFLDAIEWMRTEGLEEGTPCDGGHCFAPLDELRRKDLADYIYRAAGSPDVSEVEGTYYTDVDKDHPQINAIAFARIQGIVGGDAFGTNQTVTRQLLAVYLYRYAQGDSAPSAEFSDVDRNHPFKKEIDWVSHHGIMLGSDNRFSPLHAVNRQVLAETLFRMSEKGLLRKVSDSTTAEGEILNILNVRRRNAGLAPFEFDKQLFVDAEAWARKNAKDGTATRPSHIPNRLELLGRSSHRHGNGIAYEWDISDGSYRYVGVGAKRGSDGKWYWAIQLTQRPVSR